MKHEWKKSEKSIYLPKGKPEFVQVPPYKYFTIEGQGNPNGETFSKNVELLYGISYTVKMNSKDIMEYTVYPLEGVWDLIDKSMSHENKDNLKYKIMIRQPEFLTSEKAQAFIELAVSKKKNPDFRRLSFETIEEGACVQIMHLGPYETEPASFELIGAFCEASGLKRVSKIHREIYISDPRKVTPEKMKTVLRVQVLK